MPETQLVSLADVPLQPYLTATGTLNETGDRHIGVYAIFAQDHTLQFIGYSRDVATSLLQHLVRQPHACHWYKVHYIDRPSRTLLEDIRQAWLSEAGAIAPDPDPWTQPIDAKRQMTEDEQRRYEQGDDLERIKILKQTARRVEEQVLAQLAERGVTLSVRFNPKLKETGLLDLK